MSQFWKVRLATFLWGLITVWSFTKQIDLTSKIFITQVIGNSIIMWVFLKK